MAKYWSITSRLFAVYRSGTAFVTCKVSYRLCKEAGIGTYTKVLDVGEDLIVESKVIAGDDIDAGVFLDLPVREPEPLGFG